MAPPTLPAAAPVEPVIAAAPEQPVHPLPPLVPEGLPPASPPPSTAIASAHAEVTVKRGDTLEKIARAHKTSVEEIIKLNHLPSSFLRIGQVLKLPTKGSSVPKMATAQSRPRAPEAGLDYYTVKVGDNPWTIAMKHHLKVDELLKLNGLNEEKARKLKPGDRLRIR
jgi:LysM repeat protein